MTTRQPEALRLAEMLTANEWPGHVTLVSYARECVAELRAQHARITKLEAQLAQRFDAADMATAAAQPVAEPADTVVLNAAMRAIQQAIELIGAPTDERMRAVRRVLRGAVIVAEDDGKVAPLPSAAYAALPEYGINTASHAHFRVLGFTADQMLAFADATNALRASHGQAPAGANENAKLVTQIAECRDAFPIPARGDPIENYWSAAIEDPANVPAYLQEIAKRKQAASVLYDPKAVLDVFNSARAGSDKSSGYLRGILAVIAHWESRPEPHRWMVPVQADSVLEPLTRQQLREAFYSETACTLGGDVDFAEKVCRVVEKAHGIKGGQHGTDT